MHAAAHRSVARAGFERILTQNQASGHPIQIVNGIGDGAFARQSDTGGPEDGPIASFVFYTGNVTISVSVEISGKGAPIPTGQAQLLAMTAAGRL